MIHQLRKKFILVAMGSIFVVLAVIVGSLNAANFHDMIRRSDSILRMLASNDGRFPEDYPGRKNGMKAGLPFGEKPGAEFRGLSEETPYETRFFSVRMTGTGEVISVDTGRIAAVETADAVNYAAEIFQGNRVRGFYGNYRFLREEAAGGDVRIIFVDCSRELGFCRSLAVTSVAASMIGILAVLLLVLFFSRKVFAPVEESYAKQRRFVTDASHELKTPLTIISANVDILEMEGQEGERTASIRKQVERLKALTEQMVTLSRMDEGGVEKKFADFCLSEAAAETAELFAPIALSKGKKLSVEIEEGIAYHGDEEKIRQMISLLLDNGVKYASARGEIRLKLESCRRKGRRVCLTVWNTVDEDSGMTAGRQDRLFERFYRPDASRSSRTGGSGIGLSVVQSIVDLHRGRITAESDDGKSIRFTALL